MGETKKRGCTRKCNLFLIYTPIQEVMPKVVAIAVRTVMTMLMIFPQMFLLVFSMLAIYEFFRVMSNKVSPLLTGGRGMFYLRVPSGELVFTKDYPSNPSLFSSSSFTATGRLGTLE